MEKDRVSRQMTDSVGRIRGNRYDDDPFNEDDYNSDEDEEEEDDDVPRIAIIGGRHNEQFVREILYGTPRAGESPQGPHPYQKQQERYQTEPFDPKFSATGTGYGDSGLRSDSKEERRVFFLQQSSQMRQEGHQLQQHHHHHHHHYTQPNRFPSTEQLPDKTERIVKLSPIRQRPQTSVTGKRPALLSAVNSRSVGVVHSPKRGESFSEPVHGRHMSYDKGEIVGHNASRSPRRHSRHGDSSLRRRSVDSNVKSPSVSNEKNSRNERERQQRLKKLKQIKYSEEAENGGRGRRLSSPSTGHDFGVKEKKKKHRRTRTRSGSSSSGSVRGRGRGNSRSSRKKRMAAGVEDDGNETRKTAVQFKPVFTAVEFVPPKVRKEKAFCYCCRGKNEWSQKEKQAADDSARKEAVRQSNEKTGKVEDGKLSALEKAAVHTAGKRKSQPQVSPRRRKRRPSMSPSDVAGGAIKTRDGAAASKS
ncbi:hypothetical protein MOQ_006045 [Trypanosoma cruzi marinkellei]|uniref:Uncharacterized protein n=1 Tax=Trypanosoma cruzi marinkellei TaxID=85056 RepID=K2M5L4_TRYCR|nr:hypothetical protein MOQ_006045 [Trypanosoma cruzi marinkellei]